MSMLITTTSGAVDRLWKQLPRTDRGPITRWTARCRAEMRDIIRETGKTGWCGVLEAESVLLGTGADLPPIKMRDVIALYGATPVWTYKRPGARAKHVLAFERFAAVDLAVFLIRVERFGFEVDPAPLCEALKPALKAKTHLLDAELAVHWFAQERHRSDPVTIAVGPDLTWGRPADALRTTTGYKAELFRNEAGEAQAVKVTAPRWRWKRHPFAYAA